MNGFRLAPNERCLKLVKMREIKFDIKIRHIETGNTFREVFTLDEIISGSKLYAKGIQEVVFKRQFTGLKDKNGKEIYEGDIGKRTMKMPRFKQEMQILVDCWEIVFDKGAFSTRLFGSDKPSRYSDRFEEIEIIGNIYENPELLI